MKHAILVTGANASGKTTAVLKALEPWKGKEDLVLPIRADNDSRYKETANFQRELLTKLWLSDVPVLLIEGTRINTPLIDVAKANRDARHFVILCTTQKPEPMKAHLISRCAAKGKVFDAKYWSNQKLVYEGQKRYPNKFRASNLYPVMFDVDMTFSCQQQMIDLIQERIQAAVKSSTKDHFLT